MAKSKVLQATVVQEDTGTITILLKNKEKDAIVAIFTRPAGSSQWLILSDVLEHLLQAKE